MESSQGGLQNIEDLPSLAGCSVPRAERSQSTTLPVLKSSFPGMVAGASYTDTYKVNRCPKQKLECNKLSEKKRMDSRSSKNNIWERWLENLVIDKIKK